MQRYGRSGWSVWSCSFTLHRRRGSSSCGRCLVLPTGSWWVRSMCRSGVSSHTEVPWNFVAPLCWPLAALSAACSASSPCLLRLVCGVLLRLLFGLPPPLVFGCLPPLWNGRPEARWPEMACTGKQSPLAALPCFGARCVSTQLN
jgi:hypothetical protein